MDVNDKIFVIQCICLKKLFCDKNIPMKFTIAFLPLFNNTLFKYWFIIFESDIQYQSGKSDHRN